MSGAIRQISNFLSRNKPTIWHFRITSSLSSQKQRSFFEKLISEFQYQYDDITFNNSLSTLLRLQNQFQSLEENLEYLRAMRHKEGQVFALSIASSQKSRDTARVITFYDALKQASEKLSSYQERVKKYFLTNIRAPLYSFAEDQALGDSYLLLSLGEQVTANPFSIIGSINSRINYISFENLFERLGIKYDVYTNSTPAFLPSRKPSPTDVQLAEQSNKEVLEAIQNMIIQKRYKVFQGKGITPEQAKKDLLSGQTFTAEQALKNGTFYDFKDVSYPNHRIRTPSKYPGHIQFVPKLNKDLLVLAEMAQEIELVLGSASASTTMQSVVQSAEVRLAEFFTRKLKEPEFLIAFENYLLNEFEQQQAMVERRQELINMLS